MNRISILLLAVASLGLGAWAVWEHMQRTQLEGQVADLEAAAITQSAKGQASNRKLVDEVQALKKKIEERTVAATAENDAKTTGGSAAKKKTDAGAAMAENLAKMMTDPKMRDMMKNQARMGIDMVYRDLFDLLDLKEPQRSKFEKLITDKATAGMEAGFAMMAGDKTKEEKKAAAEEVKTKVAEIEQQIKDLLGKEDYDKVKRYEDSTMERMQLKTFNNMLTSKELGMDEATEAKLMDAMYQERQKFPFASSYIDQRNTDLARFTEENTERFHQEYGQLNEKIAARASSILSPAQLEIFRQSQEQQVNMVKMQMEMGAKMFGVKDK
ncbi:MAG TPA: hypothetical protein VG796_23210 [Verrucomicrobiales bacterium]|nr:hypothetical protein [Verrucomicrobiales bacterium]